MQRKDITKRLEKDLEREAEARLEPKLAGLWNSKPKKGEWAGNGSGF
jgi:hypothetical protein